MCVRCPRISVAHTRTHIYLYGPASLRFLNFAKRQISIDDGQRLPVDPHMISPSIRQLCVYL